MSADESLDTTGYDNLPLTALIDKFTPLKSKFSDNVNEFLRCFTALGNAIIKAGEDLDKADWLVYTEGGTSRNIR